MPHLGIDITAAKGEPVHAMGGGTVILVDTLTVYGRVIAIDHGGKLASVYAHLSSTAVGEGVEVGRGAVIGQVGSSGWVTGPHLHLEIRRSGEPLDPLRFVSLPPPDATTPARPEPTIERTVTRTPLTDLLRLITI